MYYRLVIVLLMPRQCGLTREYGSGNGGGCIHNQEEEVPVFVWLIWGNRFLDLYDSSLAHTYGGFAIVSLASALFSYNLYFPSLSISD